MAIYRRCTRCATNLSNGQRTCSTHGKNSVVWGGVIQKIEVDEAGVVVGATGAYIEPRVAGQHVGQWAYSIHAKTNKKQNRKKGEIILFSVVAESTALLEDDQIRPSQVMAQVNWHRRSSSSGTCTEIISDNMWEPDAFIAQEEWDVVEADMMFEQGS